MLLYIMRDLKALWPRGRRSGVRVGRVSGETLCVWSVARGPVAQRQSPAACALWCVDNTPSRRAGIEMHRIHQNWNTVYTKLPRHSQIRYSRRLERREERSEAERARGEARPRGEAFEAERLARRPLPRPVAGGVTPS